MYGGAVLLYIVMWSLCVGLKESPAQILRSVKYEVIRVTKTELRVKMTPTHLIVANISGGTICILNVHMYCKYREILIDNTCIFIHDIMTM